MRDSLPVVTIAIPFYNPGAYITDTLQSVYDQTYRNLELILYNDGSTDHSYNTVLKWIEGKKERFTNSFVINGEINRGVGYACDVLFKKSAGFYFQMLGADDLVYPHKIAAQVAKLQDNSDNAMIYGNMDRINENGMKYDGDYFSWQKFSTFNQTGPISGNIFPQLILENFIPASSVLVRRSVIEEVGGYDKTLKSEDWDLWLRISRKYKVLGENIVVGAYRILSTSAMHSSKSKIFVLDSINQALVKHKGISRSIDSKIKEHLYINTMEMYRLGHISKKWAPGLYSYKPGIKSLIYSLFMALGIKVNQKR